MATINDIARLAGVAKSTVSRYLNGGSVSQATKEIIEKVMKDTGYIPNTFAQSLKVKKSNLIGIIIPRLNSYATYEILESIDRSLKKHHYQLLITNTDQNIEREIEQILAFSKQKVAAIILLATTLTNRHQQLIEALDIPVLVIGQRCDFTYNFIYDEIFAGKMMAEHALSLNHHQILYLGVNEHDVAVGQLRKQGVLDVLKANSQLMLKVKEVDFNYEITYQMLLEYLPTVSPSYILCATDNIALAAYKATLALGKRVPDDVSISGFGGYSITNLVTPAITTVRYPYKEVGDLAVLQLQHILKGEEVERQSILTPVLEVKQSTRKI